MQTTENLADTVAQIQRTAIASAGPQVFVVEADDGAGGKLKVPSVVTQKGDGKTEAQVLLRELVEVGQ